jgi:hypothetical protein
MSRYDLTDFEWRVIAPLLPNKLRGVPRVDDRRVLNGIFWVLRSGAPWRVNQLRRETPDNMTIRRCFKRQWTVSAGVPIGADRDPSRTYFAKLDHWVDMNFNGVPFGRRFTHLPFDLRQCRHLRLGSTFF